MSDRRTLAGILTDGRKHNVVVLIGHQEPLRDILRAARTCGTGYPSDTFCPNGCEDTMPPTSEDDNRHDRELRYVRAREALTKAQREMQDAIMRRTLGVEAAQQELAAAAEALRRGDH